MATALDPIARCDTLKAAGNEALKRGDHAAAVKQYTKALSVARTLEEPAPVEKLQTNRVATLLANRCAAHLQLGEEREALRDAQEAAKEAPDWPKSHFRLGQAHMRRGNHTMAYSAFKRGWHLDTSNAELTKACQEAHMAMVGLDRGAGGDASPASGSSAKPMSQEDLFRLREANMRADLIAREEARRTKQTLMSASPSAPVANPQYREEALRRTQMMAMGQTDTTDAADTTAADAEEAPAAAAGGSAAVDLSDAAAEPASEPDAPAKGVAEPAGAPEPPAYVLPPELEYVLSRKPAAHEDGRDMLHLTVHTPMASSMAELSLAISHAEIRLEVDGALPLEIEFPARVDDGAAKAKYDKKGRVLTVRLPVGMAPPAADA